MKTLFFCIIPHIEHDTRRNDLFLPALLNLSVKSVFFHTLLFDIFDLLRILAQFLYRHVDKFPYGERADIMLFVQHRFPYTVLLIRRNALFGILNRREFCPAVRRSVRIPAGMAVNIVIIPTTVNIFDADYKCFHDSSPLIHVTGTICCSFCMYITNIRSAVCFSRKCPHIHLHKKTATAVSDTDVTVCLVSGLPSTDAGALPSSIAYSTSRE